MTEKIVLIGAASSNFGLGTIGDILDSKILAGSEIVLHDTNPTALERVFAIAANHVRENRLPFRVSAAVDREQALEGATFCVIAIEVGNRFELWEQDWQIPQQYGIRQVFGENGGPGGLFHSLRVLPPIIDICADIMRICPEAYVFNFSNPMSRICTTITRKFPDIKLLGLCEEIALIPEHLPRILGTPIENICFRAGGLNHLSVLLEVHYKDSDRDAYPEVRAQAPAYFETLPGLCDLVRANASDDQRALFSGLTWSKAKPWPERGLIKVILEQFGFLPITTDSHFGEYVPWAWDVVDHAAVLDFYRLYRQWCAAQSQANCIQRTQEGRRLISIIEALLTGQAYEEPAVNIPNAGLISCLPHDIAVEVPATVDGSGVHGTALENYPKGIGGLLINQYPVHDLTAEAALTGSKQAARQALLLDPVVHSYRAAEQTLETVLAVQQRYLGYLH